MAGRLSSMKPEYGKLTWEEVRDSDKDRVVILPVAATEDHGPHMALDTDTLLATRILDELANRIPDKVFVMPPIPYGFNEHHKDFPGVIWIQPETLISFVTDITESLAHHGFRRVVLFNSHGSNPPVLDLAARKTVIKNEIICVSVSYWNLMSHRINEIRKSATGGVAHACEFEASMYLYLDPENIHLERAFSQNLHDPESKNFNLDLAGGGSRAMHMNWWSAISPDGTMGEPTLADAEIGKQFFEAAVEETIGLIDEVASLPIRQRVDHH